MAATQTDPADDRPEEPPAERRAIPGVITVLDGGVPWIRDRLELDQEWDRLTRTAATLIVDDRFDYEDQDEAGRAMFGVLACALWTTDSRSRLR
jgi:hypothetical protein